MCNCRWTETIIALVVLIFTLFVSASWGQWIVIIAAIVLLIHAWTCKNMHKSAASMPKGKKK